jgi:hypothetical protein
MCEAVCGGCVGWMCVVAVCCGCEVAVCGRVKLCVVAVCGGCVWLYVAVCGCVWWLWGGCV